MSDRKKGDKSAGGRGDGAKTGGGRGTGAGGGGKARNSNWGRVLRTAYDDTLREAVPDDFLNLLGKLD